MGRQRAFSVADMSTGCGVGVVVVGCGWGVGVVVGVGLGGLGCAAEAESGCLLPKSEMISGSLPLCTATHTHAHTPLPRHPQPPTPHPQCFHHGTAQDVPARHAAPAVQRQDVALVGQHAALHQSCWVGCGCVVGELGLQLDKALLPFCCWICCSCSHTHTHTHTHLPRQQLHPSHVHHRPVAPHLVPPVPSPPALPLPLRAPHRSAPTDPRTGAAAALDCHPGSCATEGGGGGGGGGAKLA